MVNRSRKAYVRHFLKPPNMVLTKKVLSLKYSVRKSTDFCNQDSGLKTQYFFMKIVSLLPSATEIVCALGLEENLVGITHECDFPPTVAGKPPLTASRISHETMTSREIDHAVRSQLDGH